VTLRSRLRADLTVALKARDGVAVSALRSALAAIENAEAVDAGPHGGPQGASEHIAGAARGAGAGDRPRRDLREAEVRAIMREHVDELERVAAQYDGLGRGGDASTLRREVAVLAEYLGERRA
jgi:uncharacterized protein YqeY